VATLSITNQTDKTMEFPTPGGAVRIEPRASKDLSEKQLKSPVLAEALRSGTAVIARPADRFTPEQRALAKAVLPAIITSTGARLTQLRTRFDQSHQELQKLREAFNKTRRIAAENLDLVKASVEGWPGLREVAATLLLEGEEEDAAVTEKKKALEDAERALEEVKNEDLAVSLRPREEWFADRVAREAAVKAAREALAKVAREKANPLVGEIETLTAGVAAVRAIAKDRAVGGEIPEIGR
jgi:hypothetical protein